MGIWGYMGEGGSVFVACLVVTKSKTSYLRAHLRYEKARFLVVRG